MSDQRELPGPVSAAAFAAAGALVSGGKIEDFERGWGKALMKNQMRAHYFVRDDSRDKDDVSIARALCGATAWLQWIYGAGNYPHCERCDAELLKHIR